MICIICQQENIKIPQKQVNSAFEGYIKNENYLKYTLAAVADMIFSLSGVDISLLKTM